MVRALDAYAASGSFDEAGTTAGRTRRAEGAA
jgi:hypothetical protein